MTYWPENGNVTPSHRLDTSTLETTPLWAGVTWVTGDSLRLINVAQRRLHGWTGKTHAVHLNWYSWGSPLNAVCLISSIAWFIILYYCAWFGCDEWKWHQNLWIDSECVERATTINIVHYCTIRNFAYNSGCRDSDACMHSQAQGNLLCQCHSCSLKTFMNYQNTVYIKRWGPTDWRYSCISRFLNTFVSCWRNCTGYKIGPTTGINTIAKNTIGMLLVRFIYSGRYINTI